MDSNPRPIAGSTAEKEIKCRKNWYETHRKKLVINVRKPVGEEEGRERKRPKERWGRVREKGK